MIEYIISVRACMCVCGLSQSDGGVCKWFSMWFRTLFH